jgi:hypothetical protein
MRLLCSCEEGKLDDVVVNQEDKGCDEWMN